MPRGKRRHESPTPDAETRVP
ncbi:protein of unknown function [Micropruina glycogenica]|uniref:Uncharacterized protein n=1 Tax=Micropruina glycogenica TaxID=75385 RepID=A0A2N9JHT1_9ACTN|nr:protein of unknown function [Micropruina glycogenica]